MSSENTSSIKYGWIIKEEEIRKRGTLDKYLELVLNDVKKLFDLDALVPTSCPACGGEEHEEEFEKIGFTYVSCKKCATLFNNPRPNVKTLDKFYSSSESTSYWVNEFFKPVADVRRKKIFKPRAEYVSGLINKNSGLVIGDVGSGFGIFLEELRELRPENRYVAIEPSHEMAGICLEKKFEVECKFLETIHDLENSFDFLTAFEIAEHLLHPKVLFEKAFSLLKPGGLIYITTLNGQGFDIMVLWEKSKNIFPPHHLNFFNPSSLEALLEKIDFKIIESQTPGKLDWDIVEGMIRNEDVTLGRFWTFLAKHEDKKIKETLQGWIAKSGFSSHMSILAEKQ